MVDLGDIEQVLHHEQVRQEPGKRDRQRDIPVSSAYFADDCKGKQAGKQEREVVRRQNAARAPHKEGFIVYLREAIPFRGQSAREKPDNTIKTVTPKCP